MPNSTDPKTVKVIDEAFTLKDMRMMKEASINAIRLSHYPREPRFYELADSLGFYLINEVPFVINICQSVAIRTYSRHVP